MVGRGLRSGALRITSPRLARVCLAAALLAACTPSETPSSPPTPTPEAVATSTLAPTPIPTLPSVEPLPTPEPPPPVDPCGPDGTLCGPYFVQIQRSLHVTPLVYCGTESLCWVEADLYYPEPQPNGATPTPAPTPAGGLPVFVAIPGGPAALGERGGLSTLAFGLATQGAIVLTADWRSIRGSGAGYPGSFADVACAVRTARSLARRYGGDPDNVTLVSHSFGGFPSAVVAFSPRGWRLHGGDCAVAEGDTKPDAFAAIASVLDQRAIGGDYLETFYGPDATTETGAWLAGDVQRLAKLAQDRTFPLLLIHGEDDKVVLPASSAAFAALLEADGYAPELVTVPGADHVTVFERKATIAALMGLARRAAR